jgi:hypothetical protein
VDLRATTPDHPVAELARDAGRTDADVDDRAQVLRADIRTAGVTYTELALDLTLAFHHAIRDDQDQVAITIGMLVRGLLLPRVSIPCSPNVPDLRYRSDGSASLQAQATTSATDTREGGHG